MCTSNGVMDDWLGIPNSQKIAQQQAQQAAAAEARRQAAIQAVIDQINAKYDDPANSQQINQIAGDQYTSWMDQIHRARAAAERALKANMARSGMIGSSAFENAAAGLQGGEQQALAEAEARKAALARKIQAALEQGRQNLISQAQSGLSATQAQQLADRSIAQSLAQGAADAGTANWNQFFNVGAQALTGNAKAAGRQAAVAAYAPVNTPSATAAQVPVGPGGAQVQSQLLNDLGSVALPVGNY